MTVALHWETHGAVREFSGKVEFHDYMESVAQLQNDPRFDNLRYILEIFTDTVDLRVSDADMEMVIANAIGAAFSNPHIRVAAVTATERARHLVALFANSSPFITRQFGQAAQAREWLADGDTAPVPLDMRLQATTDFGDRPLVY